MLNETPDEWQRHITNDANLSQSAAILTTMISNYQIVFELARWRGGGVGVEKWTFSVKLEFWQHSTNEETEWSTPLMNLLRDMKTHKRIVSPDDTEMVAKGKQLMNWTWKLQKSSTLFDWRTCVSQLKVTTLLLDLNSVSFLCISSSSS